MTYSVHVGPVAVRDGLPALRRGLRDVPGLRHGEMALAAPLGGRLGVPPPIRLGRMGLFAWWESPEALAAFAEQDHIGRQLATGWTVELEAVRAIGGLAALPDLPAKPVAMDDDEPVVAVTMARPRLSQALRFMRTSNPAENQAMAHPGNVWTIGLLRPPGFLATVTVWRTVEQMRDYAMKGDEPHHHDAVREQRRKDFHHESAFVRFRPVREHGTVEDGLAPLAVARAT